MYFLSTKLGLLNFTREFLPVVYIIVLFCMCLILIYPQVGWTSLHNAIYFGHAMLANFLVGRGADIHAQTPVSLFAHRCIIYSLQTFVHVWCVNNDCYNSKEPKKNDTCNIVKELISAAIIIIQVFASSPSLLDLR